MNDPLAPRQRSLSVEQVEAFHHDLFVEDQVRDFLALTRPGLDGGHVVDVGGGCGFFAVRLKELAPFKVRVIDTDDASVAACRASGVEAEKGDALRPGIRGDEVAACLNLILHHLVADSEAATRLLQQRALRVWAGRSAALFVNEYIYESVTADVSGWLIFKITRSPLLSAIGRTVARIVPAFKANTFGVGVRFRSHDDWVDLFREAGYQVVAHRRGEPERVALPLRLLWIRTIRRDSFLLRPDASS